MRRLFAVALMTAMVGAIGFTQTAEAGVSYDYVFRSTDNAGNAIAGGSANGAFFTFSSTTAANACDPVSGAGCPVIDIFVNNGDPLFGTSFSVSFDVSLGLAAAAATEWGGIGVAFNMANDAVKNMAPLGGLNICNLCGTVSSFDGAIPPANGPPSLPAGSYNIGSVVWDTSSALGGLHAVMTAVITNPNINSTGAVINGTKVDVTGTETLTAGAINIVPEPATAGLLGIGLAGLALAGRRRSRS